MAVVAIVLYAIRIALLPFVFSAAIGFVMDPAIAWVQARVGLRRWQAATLLYLLLLALGGGFCWWVGGGLVQDFLQLTAKAPSLLRNLITQAIGKQGVELFGNHYTPEGLVKALGSAIRGLAQIGALTSIGKVAFGTVIGLAFTLVLTPYFMISGRSLAAGAIWLIPPERRPPVVDLLPRIIPVLRRYLIGVALVVTYTITVAWIGFGLIFHLPAGGLLAIVVGLLEMLPVIGPFLSVILVGLMAVQQVSLGTAALLMGFAIGLRLSIDNLVGPLVLGSAARVHPVVIMVSFVCGGILFGIVGLLLAVPVAVCIKITLQHYYAEPVVPNPSS